MITEKPSVLLVDDNEATCTLVTALLQREFAVEVALDGAEAIEKLRTKQYAAVLLDLLMPPPDGYAILDFVKSTRPELLKRVIIVTASLTERELTRVKEYDVCGLIPKPFDVETLLAAVKQCTSGSDSSPIGAAFFSHGGMILMLADLLRQRLL